MKALRGLREPALFYGVGALNTLLDVGLFFVISGMLRVDYLIAQIVSYTAGAANSYLLNRRLTFRRKDSPHPLEALRFAVVNAGSLGVTTLLLYLSQDLHAGLVAAKVAATLIGAAINYAGNRMWVFPPPDRGSRDDRGTGVTVRGEPWKRGRAALGDPDEVMRHTAGRRRGRRRGTACETRWGSDRDALGD